MEILLLTGGERNSVGEYSMDCTASSDLIMSPLTPERIFRLRAEIRKQSDAVAALLLGSRESQSKKERISKAFRICRDAFHEVSEAILNTGSAGGGVCSMEQMKRVFTEVLDSRGVGALSKGLGGTYAQATRVNDGGEGKEDLRGCVWWEERQLMCLSMSLSRLRRRRRRCPNLIRRRKQRRLF